MPSIILLLVLFSTSLIAWPGGDAVKGMDPSRSRNESEGEAQCRLHEWNDDDYVLIRHDEEDDPVEESDDDNVESSSLWSLPSLPPRKNPLGAYIEFAQHKNKIISLIVIGELGDTFFREANVAETLGCLALQYAFTHNAPFVEDYDWVLEKNYGRVIADKAFPPTLKQQALRFGLSSEIVFNTLKTANQEVLATLSQRFSAKSGMEHDVITTIQTDTPGVVLTQEELCEIVNRVQSLLVNTPNASTLWNQNYPDTRSCLARNMEVALQVFDSIMLMNNSLMWARRAAYSWELVKCFILAGVT